MHPLVEQLGAHAAQLPDKRAIIAGATSLSYGQLWSCIQRAARWLQEQGTEPGARVVWSSEPGDPWFAVGYFATHLLGAIAVPVDSKIAPANRQTVLDQSDATLVVLDAAFRSFRAVMSAHDGSDTHDALRSEARLDDLADVLFTSGSTGRPKGVALTHANICAAARNINQFIGNTAQDVEVVTVPLSHSFGLGRMRCVLAMGGTLVLVPGLTFPALTFNALTTHRAAGLACVPAGAALLLKWGAERLGACADHLRYMELGSAPMPREDKHRLMSLLPRTRICMHYGLTEASRSAFIEFHADAHRIDSIGRPTPNVTIRIGSADAPTLPPDTVGTMFVKADTVMQGYWRDPQRTAEVLSEDGWLNTGDLGYADADGYLHLVGRGEDVINVGGRKVYPATVESAAQAFAGVLEAGCVGEVRDVVGQTPVLYVVAAHDVAATLDLTALQRFLATRLEHYAVPTRIELVTELPKTSSGKVQRSVLRQRASAARSQQPG